MIVIPCSVDLALKKPALLPKEAAARIDAVRGTPKRTTHTMADIRLRLLGDPAAPSASDPVAGVIWITISMALFAGLAVFSRQAMNAGLHPFEVVFLRNVFACLLLVPLLVYRGRSLLRSERFGLYGVRVVVSLLSMQAWFYALSLIPIGEVTAISYLAPLFGTLGAVLAAGRSRAHPSLDGARRGLSRRHDHPAPDGLPSSAWASSAR